MSEPIKPPQPIDELKTLTDVFAALDRIAVSFERVSTSLDKIVRDLHELTAAVKAKK